MSVVDRQALEGIAAEFAARFPDPSLAQQVIVKVGLPRERQPGWTGTLSALAWWTEVIQQLEVGAVSQDWLVRLEAAAAFCVSSVADGDGLQPSATGEPNRLTVGSVSAPGGQATGVNYGIISVEMPRRAAAFVTIEEHLMSWMAPGALHHHRATLVGRKAQLHRLLEDLDPAAQRVRVVLVTGPGGRGKSRLALESLRQAANRWPDVTALVLQEQATLDGIALAELPSGPTSVLVEDAHRHSEQQLLSLLAHARKTTGMVLVLTTRGVHHTAVKHAVYRSGLDGQHDVIELERLDIGAARKLVDELLADGPKLPDAFVEHLAREGCDCPLIPVVAVELARRGKLTPGPLSHDQQFRSGVLHAFTDEIVGRVSGGVDQQTATRFLKWVCAIAPFRVKDHDLLDTIAMRVGALPDDLVTIRHALREAHVLVEANGRARVLPEILADEILATAAAVGDQDTGFAGRVWRELGQTSARWQLVTNLAEVSWRLSETGGPDVFGPVWSDVATQVDLAKLAEVEAFLAEVDLLAEVQPVRLYSLLDQLLPTLPPVHRPPSLPSEQDPAARKVETVLDRAAPLLARCAVANPTLLGGALDHLHRLALVDGRPVHQTPDHPVLLVCERLTSNDRSGFLATAGTVVSRVEAWLAAPDPTDAVRTPLFALGPLVAKSGLRTGWHRDGIALNPYKIHSDAIGDLRRRIRVLLVREGCGTSLRRTCEAVELLGAALHEPVQYVGMTVTHDDILSWEAEDLATLEAMSKIARMTVEPLVRRRLRGEVSWHATRAKSGAVRTAALTLVTELDEHDEDDLTAALLGAPDLLLPTRRGIPVPVGGAPYAEETPGTLAEQRSKARAVVWAAVAATLWDEHDAAGIVATVDERLGTIGAIRPPNRPAPGAWMLLQHVCETRPQQIRDLVHAAVGLPEGPLDDHLHVVFDAWTRHDLDAFSLALPDLLQGRPGVRRAAARGFALGWSALDTRLEAIQMEALRTGDPDLRDQLVAGTAPQLRKDPAGTAQILVDIADDAPWGITQALRAAGDYELEKWADTLGGEAAAAVLNLTQRVGWDDTNIQNLVAGITRRLPTQVLSALTALAMENNRAPDVTGLPEALDRHPAVIATWLRQLILIDLRPRTLLQDLLLAAFSRSPADGAEQALLDVAETAELGQLAHLVRGLRQCEELVITRPKLVTAILERADVATPTDIGEEIRARLRDMAHPAFWLFGDSEAPPKLVHHRDRTAEHAEDETLPPTTRAFYRDTAEWLDAVIADHLRTSEHE
jgi:hypothetical protein